MEEVDNPPASSCRAPLPAEVQQTPGTTALGRKAPKEDNFCMVLSKLAESEDILGKQQITLAQNFTKLTLWFMLIEFPPIFMHVFHRALRQVIVEHTKPYVSSYLNSEALSADSQKCCAFHRVQAGKHKCRKTTINWNISGHVFTLTA